MESIIDYVDILDKVLKNENKEQLFLQLLNENKELKEENEEWMKIQRNEYEQIKEISNLKKQNDELKNENKNFKELNEKLENENKVLEDKNKVLKNEYNELDNNYYNGILKDRNIDFKKLNKKLKELNKKLKKKNINLKKQNKKSNKEKSDKEEDDEEEDDEEEDDKEEDNEEEDDEEAEDTEDNDNKEEDYLKVLEKRINNFERQNDVLNDENEILENENEVLENENEVLENENKFLENKILENEILVINDKFLVNFENYLNQIINFYINIPIDKINQWYDNNGKSIRQSIIEKINKYKLNYDSDELLADEYKEKSIWHKEFVENYQKILDDYRNNKFYIINSFNIFIKSKDNIDTGLILFINNYGCIYGFNIIRDQWDKIICCNLPKFHLRYGLHPIDRMGIYGIEIDKSIFNYTFNYESKLSPNKIKLISKLPFNLPSSQEQKVLFSYLNFIYTNG